MTRIVLIGIVFLWVLSLVACHSNASQPAQEDPLEKAALEATAIIQRARATAMVLEAQAEADSLIAASGKPARTPTAASSKNNLPTQRTQATSPVEKADTDIEILSVGIAGDGGMIIINFKAPAEIARKWNQGNVSLIDESSKAEYKEIPVMPVIGPLIAHPIDERPGYVMLVNGPKKIQAGAMVTVILGDFKQEHIIVKP